MRVLQSASAKSHFHHQESFMPDFQDWLVQRLLKRFFKSLRERS